MTDKIIAAEQTDAELAWQVQSAVIALMQCIRAAEAHGLRVSFSDFVAETIGGKRTVIVSAEVSRVLK